MIFFRFIGKIINYIQNHFKAMLFLIFAPFGHEKSQAPNIEKLAKKIGISEQTVSAGA